MAEVITNSANYNIDINISWDSNTTWETVRLVTHRTIYVIPEEPRNLEGKRLTFKLKVARRNPSSENKAFEGVLFTTSPLPGPDDIVRVFNEEVNRDKADSHGFHIVPPPAEGTDNGVHIVIYSGIHKQTGAFMINFILVSGRKKNSNKPKKQKQQQTTTPVTSIILSKQGLIVPISQLGHLQQLVNNNIGTSRSSKRKHKKNTAGSNATATPPVHRFPIDSAVVKLSPSSPSSPLQAAASAISSRSSPLSALSRNVNNY